eukprot:TRINITY_DN7412_c0_g1_i1.p1 TRINITY_DN7412_c0_g1~~TRINITY_DN7412_c0_g1_i1.p1  ORF type:complete len:198 (-),score=13.24 TRINITY_DN7412_c0_g1_i1:63-656(-)
MGAAFSQLALNFVKKELVATIDKSQNCSNLFSLDASAIHLPREVLFQILMRCSLRDCLSVCSSCKSLYQWTKEDAFWVWQKQIIYGSKLGSEFRFRNKRRESLRLPPLKSPNPKMEIMKLHLQNLGMTNELKAILVQKVNPRAYDQVPHVLVGELEEQVPPLERPLVKNNQPCFVVSQIKWQQSLPTSWLGIRIIYR